MVISVSAISDETVTCSEFSAFVGKLQANQGDPPVQINRFHCKSLEQRAKALAVPGLRWDTFGGKRPSRRTRTTTLDSLPDLLPIAGGAAAARPLQPQNLRSSAA